MLSGYINPKCQVPVYVLDKPTLDGCTSLNVKIMMVLLVIFIMVLLVCLYFYYDGLNLPIILSVAGLALFLTILFIFIIPYLTKQSWYGYQEMYTAYGKQGVTKPYVIHDLNELNRTQMSSNAVTTGAVLISLSNLFV